MNKQVRGRRPGLVLTLGVVLLVAGAGDALAQRGRTTSSRGTKVERTAPAKKKASPSRSRSRTAAPTTRRTPSSTQSRGTQARRPEGRSSTSRGTVRKSEPQTSGTRGGVRGSTAGKPNIRPATPSGELRVEGRNTSGGTVRGDARSGGTVRGDARSGGTVRGDARSGGSVRGDARSGGSVRGDARSGGSVRGDARRGGSGYGGAITSRAPRNGPGVRGGSRVQGDRSVLRDNRLHGGRVIIPSRKWTYRRPHTVRYDRRYIHRHRPNIYVHIDWPWVVRHHRHWTPRYRYRQVVHIETVYRGRPTRANIEVETVYSHQVAFANDDFAELDIEIERLELFEGGRYLGYVDNIPSSLRQMTATVYRNGEVYFDREIFLLGDPYAGFELISTRSYDGYVLDAYHHSDGYRSGSLDLRRHRVRSTKSSRLFRPNRSDSHLPISLLPSDEGWLWDYGVEAISAAVDNYDWYYGGNGSPSFRSDSVEPYRQEDAWEYTSQAGAAIKFQRESTIQRVQ